jgi:hypothetical protein
MKNGGFAGAKSPFLCAPNMGNRLAVEVRYTPLQGKVLRL